jgi:hypothetical protein
MKLGLYQVGEGQPIARVRRGRSTHGNRGHFIPEDNGLRYPTQRALCGVRPLGVRGWTWTDDGQNCVTCTAQIKHKVTIGELIIASPAEVAEFERQRAANLGDRQARAVRVDARLAVEVHRPRGSVVGSADTRRTLHLVDCPIVGAYDRPMVSLPVEEVRRQYNADGRRTDFCQECKPFHVLDNDRSRPKSEAEAKRLSEVRGYLARQDALRKGVKPVRDAAGGMAFNGASEAAGDAYYAAGCPSPAALALGGLPHDGSVHYPDCPAEPEALLEGDVTEPDYGRCTCYDLDVSEKEDRLWQRYRERHPLARRKTPQSRNDYAPDWTL